MVIYSCEKCGKEFSQKGHYTRHLNKKNPCIVESKVKEILDQVVEKKLSELKITASPLVGLGGRSSVPEVNFPQGTNSDKIHISKPILKWVGGKTQILDKLIVEFPTEINNYHEIFLGGGSVLLTLLSYVRNGIIKIHGNIYAYDSNEALIFVYKNIQANHQKLYTEIQKLLSDLNSCGDGELNRTPKNIQEAKISKENYYYWTRSEYNKLSSTEKTSIIGSAMFIFLNKTCFRGVFRVGPNGFNVPYGHYKNPEIIHKGHLDEIHELIQNVVFECSDFSVSLSKVKNFRDGTNSGDYVYLDPPYAPEKDTSFVGYTAGGFNLDNHNSLFQLIHKLTEENIKMLLSNADVSLIRENFADKKYNISSILCRRAINSKNPKAKTMEVIIKNYS